MESLLAAICAEPDDDLRRLIFADWLDDRGDPRGEFIRLQLSDRLGEPATACRIAELEKLYGRRWAGPFADWAYMVGFRRGFPEHLVIAADVFIDLANEIFRIAPIRGVSLIGAGRKTRQLVQLPALIHLSALHLTGTRVGDRGVARLASCEHLTNLQTLRLGHCRVTSKAVAHLCTSQSLMNLKELDLADNDIDSEAVAALANSSLSTRLTRLDLRNNQLRPRDTRKLQAVLPSSCQLLTDRGPKKPA